MSLSDGITSREPTNKPSGSVSRMIIQFLFQSGEMRERFFCSFFPFALQLGVLKIVQISHFSNGQFHGFFFLFFLNWEHIYNFSVDYHREPLSS